MTATGWLARAGGAVVLLHAAVFVFPALLHDDFQILEHAGSWAETRAGFWVPQNEHTMPLGRLSTWALFQLAPDPRVLAYLCSLQGLVAVLVGLPLVYHFVRREVGSPPVAVVAAMLFGVSSIYQQAVVWFAASFSVLALDTTLVALLAAQAWRQTGRWAYLALCLLACFLAPGWFASGILAGPLCAVYLLAPSRDFGFRLAASGVVPLLGSALYLAVALPQAAATILHLEHYSGRTAVEAFKPLVGALYTARSLVDNLFLGQFGLTLIHTPVWLAAVVLLALLVGLVVWLWPVRDFRLPLLGLGMILAPYLLTYSARGTWDYDADRMATPLWNRYHLFPQVGVAFLVAAGLAARLRDATFSPAWNRALGWLLVGLFLVQLPRGVACVYQVWDQWPALARVAEVDARCREHGIGRDAAVAALPPWTKFLYAPKDFNAWRLLHGSPTPRDVPPEEIRRLLE